MNLTNPKAPNHISSEGSTEEPSTVFNQTDTGNSSIPTSDTASPSNGPPLKLFSFRRQLIPFVFILLGIAALFIARTVVRSPAPTPATRTTPSIAPTISIPAPNKNLSPVATQSAFIAIEEPIASLSAEIDLFNPNDPSLTPPNITVPLELP